MSKTARFSQADLTRAVKAAEKLGYRVKGWEIGPDGTIRLEFGDEPANDWRAGSPLYENRA